MSSNIIISLVDIILYLFAGALPYIVMHTCTNQNMKFTLLLDIKWKLRHYLKALNIVAVTTRYRTICNWSKFIEIRLFARFIENWLHDILLCVRNLLAPTLSWIAIRWSKFVVLRNECRGELTRILKRLL